MIRVFADTAQDAKRILGAAGGPVQVVDTLDGLNSIEADTDCLIIGVRRPFLRDRIPLFRNIGRMLPALPVILVTDRDADVARLLSRVRVSQIVWFEEVQTELRRRISTAVGTTALEHLAERVRRSSAPPALRAALAYSLQRATDTPIRNVKLLAADLRFSPVTLRQEFSARSRGATTLNSYLSALVLLRAHQIRESGVRWKAVSRRLGFARDTLNRKAKSWLGCTLTELERIHPDHLLAVFVANYIDPLLDGHPPGRETGARFRDLPR